MALIMFISTVSKYSAIALGNLTCEDAKLRNDICAKDGVIEKLISMLNETSLREHAISVLANITYENKIAAGMIIKYDGN